MESSFALPPFRSALTLLVVPSILVSNCVPLASQYTLTWGEKCTQHPFFSFLTQVQQSEVFHGSQERGKLILYLRRKLYAGKRGGCCRWSHSTRHLRACKHLWDGEAAPRAPAAACPHAAGAVPGSLEATLKPQHFHTKWAPALLPPGTSPSVSLHLRCSSRTPEKQQVVVFLGSLCTTVAVLDYLLDTGSMRKKIFVSFQATFPV